MARRSNEFEEKDDEKDDLIDDEDFNDDYDDGKDDLRRRSYWKQARYAEPNHEEKQKHKKRVWKCMDGMMDSSHDVIFIIVNSMIRIPTTLHSSILIS